MLSLSWSELAIIAFAIIMLIGPKDVPVVIRTMRGFWHKLQTLKQEVSSTISDIAQEADPNHMLQDYADDINQKISKIADEDGNLYDAYPVPKVTRAKEEASHE